MRNLSKARGRLRAALHHNTSSIIIHNAKREVYIAITEETGLHPNTDNAAKLLQIAGEVINGKTQNLTKEPL